MGKTASATVKESVARSGKTRRIFTLTPERDAQLQRLTGRFGTMQATFDAALDALDGYEPSNRELLAMLAKRLPGC